MKVVHFSLTNGSGMHHVAESLVEGEKKLGIDSHLVNPLGDEKNWIWDADINVSHTHIPDVILVKNQNPTVWVAHGNPDHVFETSVDQVGYGHSDSWMLCQNWLRKAHACVTFWPRHQKMWQSMCQRGRTVDLVTLGVDRDFWKRVPSRGPYAGAPSVFTAENFHWGKSPLALMWTWGTEIRTRLPKAVIHFGYVPHDKHRWVFPLINSNGTSYGSYTSASVLGREDLRNAFVSSEFYIGLVRNGEWNRISLEANACGIKTISYKGNPYSDFWIDEGNMYDYLVPQLIDILSGKTEPRKKKKVPDISQTVKEFSEIYARIGRAGA